MNIGLYNYKEWARGYLTGFLPYFEKIHPNWISAAIIPLGLLTAWVYALGNNEDSFFYLLGIFLLALRLLLGMLDGMVAEKYEKSSPLGNLINKLSPEFADMSLMIALALTAGNNSDLAIWAVGIGWATSVLSLSGLMIGKEVQSQGPVGQTDRLLALALFSLPAAFFSSELFMGLFYWWCIFGGMVTCALRLSKLIYEDRSQNQTETNL